MQNNAVKECCDNCSFCSYIEVWDYTKPDVPKTEGFLCHTFEKIEGYLPIYLKGTSSHTSHCEMFNLKK